MESGCYMALNMITTTMDWNVRRGARYLGTCIVPSRTVPLPSPLKTQLGTSHLHLLAVLLLHAPPSCTLTHPALATTAAQLRISHCSVVIDTPPCALHVHVHDRLRETGDDSRGNTVAAIRHLRTTRVCASDIPTAAVANSRRRADTRDTHSAKAFAEPARGRDQKATMNVNGNAPTSCIPARS